MAITAYTGLPGSGKSHSVVEHVILPALKAGRCVVTNVAMHWDKVREAFPDGDLREISPDALKAAGFGEIDELLPHGCVLVLDEVWRVWPQGLKAADVSEAHKELLAMHRHRKDAKGRSMEVVLVTQDLSQLARFARDLVDETFRTVKLSSVGADNRYRVDVYRGPAVGPNPPERTRIRQIFGKYRSEVWQWYRSHTLAEAEGVGVDESKTDKRGIAWKSPALIAMFVAIPLCLGFGIWAVVGFFKKDRNFETQVQRPAVAAPVASSGKVPSRVAPAVTWRIAGEMAGGGIDKVYLESMDGTRWVELQLSRYCDRDISGFLICTFEGQRISDQIKFRPRVAPAPVAVPSLLGGPPSEAT